MIDNLDLLSDVLQIINFLILVEDSSNNDLMRHLQQQDNILNEQTEVYLKRIDEKLDKLLAPSNFWSKHLIRNLGDAPKPYC